MKEKLKKRIKIKINKIYKENMSQDEQGYSSEPKEEDFSWTKENNLELKKKYINLPFDKWIELINKHKKSKDCSYQEMVNVILKYYIFTEEVKQKKFLAEKKDKKNNITASLYEDLNEYIKDNPNIIPDFIVKNIESTKLLDIIQKGKDMFRYDSNFIKLEKYNSINIVGEIKTNPDSINSRNQRERYIKFCEKMNNKNNNKGVYYLILYVFDQSFQNFWEKTFFNNNPIIIGYIPQLFNGKCKEKQKEMAVEIKNLIEEQKKRENVELKIKEEILNFSINETEKSTNIKKTDETPETNEPKHSSEDNKNTNNNQFEKNKNPREANEQQNLSGNNSQQRQSPEETEENLRKKKEKLYNDMINKKKKLSELDNNISNINKNRMEKKSKIIELEKELNLQELELENQKIQKEKEENDLKNISEEMKEIKFELNFISLKKSILMELSINKNENLLGKKRNDNNEDE